MDKHIAFAMEVFPKFLGICKSGLEALEAEYGRNRERMGMISDVLRDVTELIASLAGDSAEDIYARKRLLGNIATVETRIEETWGSLEQMHLTLGQKLLPLNEAIETQYTDIEPTNKDALLETKESIRKLKGKVEAAQEEVKTLREQAASLKHECEAPDHTQREVDNLEVIRDSLVKNIVRMEQKHTEENDKIRQNLDELLENARQSHNTQLEGINALKDEIIDIRRELMEDTTSEYNGIIDELMGEVKRLCAELDAKDVRIRELEALVAQLRAQK